MTTVMAIDRRSGGAPRWGRLYAGCFAAVLLLTLTVIYLTTVHVQAAVTRLNRAGAAPRPVHGVPYADLINRIAAARHLDPALVAAVVVAESGFNPQARSRRGAYGLMQVMPDTWREIGLRPACDAATARLTTPPCMDDPAANLSVGTAYLRGLVRRFGGDLVLAVAAYNAGAETVQHHRGVPPYPETNQYLRQVALARFHLRQDGTLTPFWRGVVRSLSFWQHARAALVGGLAALALPWFWRSPRRRPAAGGRR